MRRYITVAYILILLTIISVIKLTYGSSLEERLLSSDLIVKREALRELKAKGESAIPMLKKMLKHNNPDIREIAVIRLGELKAREAVEDIIRVMKEDRDKVVRMQAVYTLISMKEKRSIKDLIDITRNGKEVQDRMVAIIGLGNIIEKGDAEYEEVIKTFKEALRDKSGYVRMHAAYMLGKFGYDTGYEVAIRDASSENRRVREYAIEALGEIGKEEGIKVIEEGIRDKDIWIRIKSKIAKRKIELKGIKREMLRKMKKRGDIIRDKIRYLREVIDKEEIYEVQVWACEELVEMGEEGIEELKDIIETGSKGGYAAWKTLERAGIRIK